MLLHGVEASLNHPPNVLETGPDCPVRLVGLETGVGASPIHTIKPLV